MGNATRGDLREQGHRLAVGTALAFLAVLWLICSPAPRLFELPAELGGGRAGKPVHLGEDAPRVPATHHGNTLTVPAEVFWTVLTVLGAVLVAYIGALIVRGLPRLPHLAIRFLRRRRSRRVRRVAADLGALPGPPAALLDGDDEFHALLREGAVADAIIACWVRLEEAATEAGVGVFDFETSTEYTARVLSLWVDDDVPLLALAELYREARFSRHDLPESKRADAHAALAALLAGLRATWEETHASA